MGSSITPPVFIILGLAIFFGVSGSILMIIATATDYWEDVTYRNDSLSSLDNIVIGESVFSPKDGYYVVVIEEHVNENNITKHTFYLRDTYGGIWRMCDRISEETRQTAVFKAAIERAPYLKDKCFDYIPDYKTLEYTMDENGVSLVRMQNSAASCSIVGILCLITAAITGIFGLCQKQVSACMVTGVMYMVAAVFLCFALIIMETKVGQYIGRQCHTLDPLGAAEPMGICNTRDAGFGYSVPLGWTGFTFLFITSAFWLYIARGVRLERSKSLL